LLDVNLQYYGKYLDEAQDASVLVDQGNKAFIKTANQEGLQFADVIATGTDDVFLQNIRWTDNFYDETVDGAIGRVVYELDDVSYKIDPSGTKQTGNLELVETVGTKQVFVRVVDEIVNTGTTGIQVIDDFLALAPKIDNISSTDSEIRLPSSSINVFTTRSDK